MNTFPSPALHCPVDGRKLHGAVRRSLAVYCCDSCHGIWTERRHLNVETEQAVGRISSLDLKQRTDVVADKACPRCATPRLHTRRVRGLELDLCPVCHGVWFDRGELDRLTALLPVYAAGLGGSRGERSWSDVADAGDLGELLIELAGYAPELAARVAGALLEGLLS